MHSLLHLVNNWSYKSWAWGNYLVFIISMLLFMNFYYLDFKLWNFLWRVGVFHVERGMDAWVWRFDSVLNFGYTLGKQTLGQGTDKRWFQPRVRFLGPSLNLESQVCHLTQWTYPLISGTALAIQPVDIFSKVNYKICEKIYVSIRVSGGLEWNLDHFWVPLLKTIYLVLLKARNWEIPYFFCISKAYKNRGFCLSRVLSTPNTAVNFFRYNLNRRYINTTVINFFYYNVNRRDILMIY